MDAPYEGVERRADDTVISMLREQISDTSTTLQNHVADCSSMQKRVLIICCISLVWLIAHSPEAARLAAKAFPSFGG